MDLIKPKALKAGDTIAVVAPSWGGPGTFPQRYEAGKRQLAEAFGVNVIEMAHTLKPADWVSQNPQARAEDLIAAFADPNIHGIIAAIGGDDSIRLLPHLDLDVIRQNPKVFMGYSDTTSLHFACMAAGLSSFYGPSIMSGFGENGGLFPYMEDAVRATIFSTQAPGDIPQAEAWTDEHLDWKDPENQKIKRKLREPLGRQLLQGSGIVEGHLVGGCLEVIPMIVGTDWWPERDAFDGAVMFFETSEDVPPPEYIRYYLRNFGVQGILARLNGILVGRPKGVQDLMIYDRVIQSVVRDEFGLADLPILTQMDFGHTDPMCVLPYGAMVRINCEQKTVTLPESACV